MADVKSVAPSVRHNLPRRPKGWNCWNCNAELLWTGVFFKEHIRHSTDREPSELSVHSGNENGRCGKTFSTYKLHTLHGGYGLSGCTKTIREIPKEKNLYHRREFLLMLTVLVHLWDKNQNLCQSLVLLPPHIPPLQFLAKDNMTMEGYMKIFPPL